MALWHMPICLIIRDLGRHHGLTLMKSKGLLLKLLKISSEVSRFTIAMAKNVTADSS